MFSRVRNNTIGITLRDRNSKYKSSRLSLSFSSWYAPPPFPDYSPSRFRVYVAIRYQEAFFLATHIRCCPIDEKWYLALDTREYRVVLPGGTTTNLNQRNREACRVPIKRRICYANRALSITSSSTKRHGGEFTTNIRADVDNLAETSPISVENKHLEIANAITK